MDLIGPKLPKGNDAEHREIGKQERSHGRSSINKVIERVHRGPAQISLRMQYKSPQAHARFQQQRRTQICESCVGNGAQNARR